MLADKEQQESQEYTLDQPVNIVGAVQSLVIGDHNTVNPSFTVTRHDAYVAQESPSVPPYWVERGQLVSQAASALTPGSVVTLCGMSGSGKSTLAARIAAEVAPHFLAGCFWVDLEADNIDEVLLRIALAFGHDISLLKSRQDRARTMRSLLTGQSVLLVLNNAWSTLDTDVFLPVPQSCAALVTTCNDAVAASVSTADVISVGELSETDAISLLAKLSGAPASEPYLGQIAKALGQLPLALELAGKLARQQARRPGFSWQTFSNYFSEGDRRLALGLAGTSVRAAFDATWSHALEMNAHHAFTLLGIFKIGNIYTAEAAACWDTDEQQTQDRLNQLLDLSLVKLVDPVTIRIHPLLADYAKAMLEKVEPEKRTCAHCRVADYLLETIPRPLQNLHGMAVLLHSHYHAAMARDSKRASRIYPWFDDSSDDNIAVGGFLIDYGQHHALVELRRQHLHLSENNSDWSRSFDYFYLGSALKDIGQLEEAEKHMIQAVKLVDNPDTDFHHQSLGLGKFLMGLGQVQLCMGKLDAAEVNLKRMVDFDRKVNATGEYGSAHSNALTGLLQLADLYTQSTEPDALEQTERICHEVYNEAEKYGIGSIAVMALARLTSLYLRLNQDRAVVMLRHATEIGKASEEAFYGRQGARYARNLADCAVEMALNGVWLNGKSVLEDALDLLCLAISNASRSESRQELGQALYQLGNLFEHVFIIGRDSPLTAAWACYALSEAYLKDNEGGSPLNAQFRIDERITPRIEETNRTSVAKAVAADPWRLIEEALSPRKLDLNLHHD